MVDMWNQQLAVVLALTANTAGTVLIVAAVSCALLYVVSFLGDMANRLIIRGLDMADVSEAIREWIVAHPEKYKRVQARRGRSV